MRHHAFIIEAEAEEGIRAAQAWGREELGMAVERNPDFVVLRYGLLSIEDARKITEAAAQAPFMGAHKVLVIAASRAYHEAQNALLKAFEEQPQGSHLFLILPTLGNLLPTLRSRVQELKAGKKVEREEVPEIAETFLKAAAEKRSELIKKLVSGKDEDERREKRDEVIALVNGIEAAAYAHFRKDNSPATAALLQDIATLRGTLYDRSAPVRMVLEHLSLVLPKGLGRG